MSYTVAVRTLCEFTAKRGDLDLRFTPAPDASEGRAGHAAIAARRPEGFETEVALAGSYGPLTVRGRADGYDPARQRLEEFKTYRGDLDAMRENQRALHWAQLRVYGALMCEKLGIETIELALVYYDIASGRETALVEQAGARQLREAFEAQCERFVAWANQESAHRAARDAALETLRLPHASFRAGQRELAEGIWRAATQGRCLLAQAPTGIGKTLGTLFPQLKACSRAAIDKVFFLSAKSSGRQLALDALETLAAAQDPADAPASTPLPLRVLELVAREKACEHPDLACHGESCSLARGFYDRLPAARSAALARVRLDRAALRDVAREHAVCPYYLSQELARWCDVIVGDYNYYFDVSAMLFMLAAHNQWRASVLVDEAHNLPERARTMYSAELTQTRVDAVRRAASAPVKRALARLQRHWNAQNAVRPDAWRASDTLPAELLAALGDVIGAIADQLAEPGLVRDPEMERFYFDALHFARMAERFDEHAMFDITPLPAAGARRTRSVLCIRNVVPAGALRPRVAAAHSLALFSATLAPTHYYTDMLGLPANTVNLDIGTPFSAAQLDVQIARHISTRYKDRARSLDAIIACIAAQYRARPGNYLCFFSSYEYLQLAADAIVAQHPHIDVWLQSRTMDEAQQQAFVARFVEGGRGLGFAVLGGAFGEGIDLPGTRLIGSFIATLGMPQVNPVNEALRERMDTLYGAGFDYTYLIPGLRKVVQAAGRVIRSEQDRGVVHLLDDRFARPDVRALLPGWWQLG
ncbi:ATP-dependent DNA helicase [Paraburkholderia ferrariae]|uniref:ATP-dependent DNA helicase n=1 Tax=Paraburkholderia ferrariae TaxID=386056 RepID=UPI0004839D49|nr:ATP-dependent DNA helicase [Paraburkholderia ferrariae]